MRTQGTMCQMGVKVKRIHSQPQEVAKRRCGLLSKFFDHLLLLLINKTKQSYIKF